MFSFGLLNVGRWSSAQFSSLPVANQPSMTGRQVSGLSPAKVGDCSSTGDDEMGRGRISQESDRRVQESGTLGAGTSQIIILYIWTHGSFPQPQLSTVPSLSAEPGRLKRRKSSLAGRVPIAIS